MLFLRRPGSQAQFSAQLAAQIAERDALREVQRWIADHPDADLTVAALAARAGMSERHFARCFRAEIGVTPARYVERARVEAARRLLEETDRAGRGRGPALRLRHGRDPAPHIRALAPPLPRRVPPTLPHRGQRLTRRSPLMDIAILLFDRFTALDAVGPYEVLGRLPGADSDLRGHEVGPVRTDTGRLALVGRRRPRRRARAPTSS